MEFRRAKRVGSVLDVTPLIDVVFLLLMFYMLSSTFLTPEGLTLDLPQSDSSEPRDPSVLEVTLLSANEVSVGDNQMPISELGSYLSSALPASDKSVVLKSEADAPVQAFVDVMDSIRAAGIEQLTIASRARE